MKHFRSSTSMSPTTFLRTVSGAIGLVTLLTAFTCSGVGLAPYNETISESALRADLHALAHDSTRGRYVGTPEIERASDWIRDRFDSLGLAPAGDDSTYDQRFDLMWFTL